MHELAIALGWPLPRVRDAAAALEQRLAGGGVELNDAGWNRLRLVANEALLSRETRQRLASATTRKSMSIATAEMLVDVAERRVDEEWIRRASEQQRRVLASVMNQGLVVLDEDRRPRLSDAAAFSLGYSFD